MRHATGVAVLAALFLTIFAFSQRCIGWRGLFWVVGLTFVILAWTGVAAYLLSGG